MVALYDAIGGQALLLLFGFPWARWRALPGYRRYERGIAKLDGIVEKMIQVRRAARQGVGRRGGGWAARSCGVRRRLARRCSATGSLG